MKKTLIKIFLAIFSFGVTLVLTSIIMNRGNVNTTKEMEKAFLPIVYMNIDGENVNALYGYTSEMDLGLLRESITPLDDQRGITFRIDKFGCLVNNISIKVRTVDGSRLIETIDVKDYTEDDYGILAYVTLKDLIEEYNEYSLQIYLSLSNGKDVFYHTRVVEAPSYCTKEKLQFVRNFVEKEISKEDCQELRTYMESNYLGDNTTLAKVGIHSSMDQLSFGNLSVTRVTDPVITIKEIASETGIFLVDYQIEAKENGETTRYFVEEYFRIKYLPEVIYLLDYERNMNRVEYGTTDMVRTEDILLGIRDEDIELIESDDGNIFAFENSGSLFSYNISENRLTDLFSFYDDSNFDKRTYHRDYDIKALTVDEAGNVWYAVCGYMNRGTYEGRVGIALYFYNGVTSVIEEEFFIPSDKPAEVVRRDIDELCYMSREGIFYLMLDKSIYAIDTVNDTYEILVDNLEENKYTVSSDSSLMVWQTGDDVNASASIMLMNLNTKQISEIAAPSGQYVKPLAFAGEDLIYGFAYIDDVVTDRAGRTTFPMYLVKIQSKFGEILKQYKEENVYVTGVNVKDNLLTLDRVSKADSETLSYTPASPEYITNNQVQEELQNVTNVYAFGNYEEVVRILLKKEVQTKVMLVSPKETIYEGTKEYPLESTVSEKDYYYVYYKGKLQKIYTNSANAVKEANDNYGIVVNDKGYYVWYRANRAQRNQIMDLSVDGSAEPVENKLAYCMDMMLGYEGIVRNSEYLLREGGNAVAILDDALEDKDVLDLTGCSLDSILYYVNRDIPVLGITSETDAYLVLGFNQLSAVLFDPDNGWYKIGLNEAEKLFSETGNHFVTYVDNK